jgi:hypothetical protein
LNSLQKSMDFTPLAPSAGPTGGDGAAFPAPTTSRYTRNKDGILVRIRECVIDDALTTRDGLSAAIFSQKTFQHARNLPIGVPRVCLSPQLTSTYRATCLLLPLCLSFP